MYACVFMQTGGGGGDGGRGGSDIDDEGIEEHQLTGETVHEDSKTKSMAENEIKSKAVDGEEEPRSKMLPEDDTPSSRLWDLPDDFDVYCINQFESVTVGKEAGWPGQWEEVEEEMSEEQLLYSLQVKGSAMSDEAWQEHWAQVGPGMLASSWLEQYPSIPLTQVEQVTGVTFLSQAIQSSKLTSAVEKLSLNENSAPDEDAVNKEEMNKNLDPPDLSGLSIDDTAAKADDQGTAHQSTTGHQSIAKCDQGTADDQSAADDQDHDQSTADDQGTVDVASADATEEGQTQSSQQSFSNEEISEMWSNFYNQYYWYCYQQFVGEVGGAYQQSSINLIEDYVTARKCYDPADCLVTADTLVMAEQDNVVPPVDDKTVSLAPDGKVAEQNAKMCCTDSEPANEITPTEEEEHPADSMVTAEQEEVVLPVDDKVVSLSPDGEIVKQNKTLSHANSKPANEITPTKDEVPATQSTTQPCSDSQKEYKKETTDSQQCGGQTEEPSSKEHLKNELPNPQESCSDDKPSNPEQPGNEKDNQPSPVDNDKTVTNRVDTKHIWQISKSAQYTSIVWALQEAGIISSVEATSEVVNDQTPCDDHIHCNGTTPDKESNNCEGDDTTDGTPAVSKDATCNTIPSSSSAITDSQSQSERASLKRKR